METHLKNPPLDDIAKPALIDIERSISDPEQYHEETTVPIDEINRTHEIRARLGIFRRLRHAEEWLDKLLGIETQGIDRIPEESKRPPSVWNAFWMWWSPYLNVGLLPIGMLGPLMGLSFKMSLAAGISGGGLGALLPAYTGTLGPRTGLRQVAIARYAFGFWGAKLCAILNIIVVGGFAIPCLVVAGQILSAVSDYNMSISVGIIIISVISLVVSVFGFALIHTFEKYAWVVFLIFLCVLVAQAAPFVDSSSPSAVGDSGLALAGPFLSFLAISFSSTSTWCSVVSDYYCNYPSTTPAWKIASMTFWGMALSYAFLVSIGISLGNIVASATPTLADAYAAHGLGGMIALIFYPAGFIKFALVVMIFSTLGNQIITIYSTSLALQLLGHYFHAVPRLIWSIIYTIVLAVLSIAGQENLSVIVSNFISLLSYWTISFTLIVLIEDKFFRRHSGYNLKVWDDPAGLPLGIAAILSLLAGYLGGGLPGMTQVWFVGPIAAMFGGTGGDVGIYLAGAITLVTYPVLRTIEMKYTHR